MEKLALCGKIIEKYHLNGQFDLLLKNEQGPRAAVPFPQIIDIL
jgi:hypothetical protein